MRKRVYVAAPISRGNLTTNLHQAFRAGMSLLSAGFAPLVPHGSCFWGNRLVAAPSVGPQGVAFRPEKFSADVPHQVWLDIDLPWVAVADAVLRLPGESTGADMEVEFAIENGIPVFRSLPDLIVHFGLAERHERERVAGLGAAIESIGEDRPHAIDGAHASADFDDAAGHGLPCDFRDHLGEGR